MQENLLYCLESGAKRKNKTLEEAAAYALKLILCGPGTPKERSMQHFAKYFCMNG